MWSRLMLLSIASRFAVIIRFLVSLNSLNNVSQFIEAFNDVVHVANGFLGAFLKFADLFVFYDGSFEKEGKLRVSHHLVQE